MKKVERRIQCWDPLPSHLSPKHGKTYTVLRSAASKFFIASQQKMEKYVQCWDLPPLNLSPRRARDPPWILDFLLGIWLEIKAFLRLKVEKRIQCWDLLLPNFSWLRTQKWKSTYSAEICCFEIFHRFAPTSRKVRTVLRSAAAKCVNAPRMGHCWNHCFSRKT